MSEKMMVYLKSDFMDYYDFMFDSTGHIFERMSVTDMSRADALQKLASIGFPTPAWGTVHRLITRFPYSISVVVYEVENAHRGMFKHLLRLDEAMKRFPNKLASLYVPPSFDDEDEKPSSFRYLRIGAKRFWLQYTSEDDWRSNCGSNVEIKLETPPLHLTDFHDNEHIPLLAIDFVKCCYGGCLAIDYNTSPGLRGTPIEEEMTATQIVEEIRAVLSKKRLG
jgi:hypothetical protein